MRTPIALFTVFAAIVISAGGCGSDDGPCRASEGESCDPDSCPCAGFPSGPVQCRLMPSGSANQYECVDTTPQNKPLGETCVFDFECTSDHCYTLTTTDPRECQDSCVAAATVYPSEDPGGVTDDCCGGFASCSAGECTCH